MVANPTLGEVNGDSPKHLWEQESNMPLQEPLCFLVTEKFTRFQILLDLQSDIQISYKDSLKLPPKKKVKVRIEMLQVLASLELLWMTNLYLPATRLFAPFSGASGAGH